MIRNVQIGVHMSYTLCPTFFALKKGVLVALTPAKLGDMMSPRWLPSFKTHIADGWEVFAVCLASVRGHGVYTPSAVLVLRFAPACDDDNVALECTDYVAGVDGLALLVE
jgi:hypothetical protein